MSQLNDFLPINLLFKSPLDLCLKIPPLPAALNRLISEINRSEPDIDRLVQYISADPEITARVIKTVNSSLYSPRVPVADVKRAVTMLEAILFNRIIGGLPYPLWRAFFFSASDR